MTANISHHKSNEESSQGERTREDDQMEKGSGEGGAGNGARE